MVGIELIEYGWKIWLKVWLKLNFGVYYAKCANIFSLRPEEDAAINMG